jgi:hypothetical protein
LAGDNTQHPPTFNFLFRHHSPKTPFHCFFFHTPQAQATTIIVFPCYTQTTLQRALVSITAAHRRAKTACRDIITSLLSYISPAHSSTHSFTVIMSSDRTVSIVAPAGGRKKFVALNVPIKNLATYSAVAKHHFFPGAGSRNPVGMSSKRNLSNRTEFDLGEGIDEGYARTIAAFIKAADPSNPKLITLSLFGTNDLPIEELIKIWRAIGYGFKVPRDLHDESVRDNLRTKLYATNPYTFAQFKLICDNVDFDRGIAHSAMDRVTFLHVKGYLDDKTKKEVEDYCKSREGYWDSLLETVGRVTKKIEDAAREKAAREQQQQDKPAQKNKGPAKGNNRPNNNSTSKTIASSSKPKGPPAGNNKSTAPRQAPQAGQKTSSAQPGSSKNKGSKAKPKPFVRKDDDFPPLA